MALQSTADERTIPARRSLTREQFERYFSLFSIGLLSASLFSNGLISFEFMKLSVTSWDIAVIVLAANAVVLVANHGIGSLKLRRTVVVLGLLFLAWMTVAALRSSQEFRAATMVLLLVRDYVMILSLVVVLSHCVSITWFTKALFVTGVLSGALAVILYLPNTDLLDSRRPLGSIIILIDEFAVPRLTGMSNDPNFYAMTSAMALLGVLAFALTRRLAWIWVGVVVMAIAMIFTFSRGGAGAAGTGVLVAILATLFHRNRLQRKTVLMMTGAVVVLSGIAFLAVLPIEMNMDRNVWDIVELRLGRLDDSPRFGLWSRLLEDEIPSGEFGVKTLWHESDFVRALFGNGLRSNELLLGNYSHSSYLDLSKETGIIGLVIWIVIAGLVALVLIRHALSERSGIIWLGIFAVVLVGMVSLSLLVMPYLWVVVAVAVYLSGRANTSAGESDRNRLAGDETVGGAAASAYESGPAGSSNFM